MTTKDEAIRAAVEALEALLAWDRARDYIVPYKVRDPIITAIYRLREAQGEERDAVLKAARDAATSLETISQLAGRKTYGDPPIKTYMDTFMDVRLYAAARAKAAREELAAALSTEEPKE